MFTALVLHKDEAGFRAGIESLDDARLPPLADGEVLVAVEYSSLNYKDGLAFDEQGPVVRVWPMVPGIDGAGTVIESRHARWHPGDRIVHNGWGVGESRWGCLAERAVSVRRRPGAIAERLDCAAGDGHRYGRLYRDALCAGIGAARRRAWHGRRPGDRRDRWRRQRGRRLVVAAGSSRGRGHGQGQRGRLLEGARCR